MMLLLQETAKKQRAGSLVYNGAASFDRVNNFPRINVRSRPLHSIGFCVAGGLPSELTPLETYVLQLFLSENTLGLVKRSTLCVRYLGESVQPWQELVDLVHCSVLTHGFLQHCHAPCPPDDIGL